MSKQLERFVIALPLSMPVQGYESINKRGGSVATTNKGAIGNYLHRTFPFLAKIVIAKLRENYGNYSNFAMKLSEDYRDEKGKKIIGNDLISMQEIETAVYFSNTYGQDPIKWLKESIRILEEFY